MNETIIIQVLLGLLICVLGLMINQVLRRLSFIEECMLDTSTRLTRIETELEWGDKHHE